MAGLNLIYCGCEYWLGLVRIDFHHSDQRKCERAYISDEKIAQIVLFVHYVQRPKKEAAEKGVTNPYHNLIIDEAQVFKKEWLKDIVKIFQDKPILACCDETQVFSYEEPTT